MLAEGNHSPGYWLLSSRQRGCAQSTVAAVRDTPGNCGMPGNLLWPAASEHHWLPLPSSSWLLILLSAGLKIDPVAAYPCLSWLCSFLGIFFPIWPYVKSRFWPHSWLNSQLGLRDPNSLSFSLKQSLFSPWSTLSLFLHFLPPYLFICNWDSMPNLILQQAVGFSIPYCTESTAVWHQSA